MSVTAPVTRPTMYCCKCGYILDGLPENRCPECGSAFNPLDANTFRPRPLRIIPIWVVVVVALASLPVYAGLVVATQFFAVLFCPFLVLVPAMLKDYYGKRGTFFPAAVPMAAMLIVECLCIWLAYYTLGEVEQFLQVLVYVLNIAPCVLWLFAYRRGAGILFFLIAVPLLVPQATLGLRLWRLNREVAQIVAYVEGVERAQGKAPVDLSGYSFRWPLLKDYIRYSPVGYRINYWVVQPGISHWYDRTTGWGYYPD